MARRLTTPNGSGPLLEQARRSRGLTIEDMAASLDMEPAALAEIERDGIGGGMGIDELTAIGDTYGLALSTIAQAAEDGLAEA